MKKIAQIVNETPDFAFSGEGCTPCECGDTGACIQERIPLLESIPTEVINYALFFAIILITILIVISLTLLVIKIVKLFIQRFK